MIPESSRSHLIGKVVQCPRCKIGKILTCVIRGDTIVTRLRETPHGVWPVGRSVVAIGPGGHHMIVTPELADAIGRESSIGIMRMLGVGKSLVTTWRRELGIAQHNAGTLRLKAEETGTPETLAAYNTTNHPALWSDDDLALLGTDSDAAIAVEIGKTQQAVAAMRRRRGIKAIRTYSTRQVWCDNDDAIVSNNNNATAAQILKRTVDQIKWRRSTLRKSKG